MADFKLIRSPFHRFPWATAWGVLLVALLWEALSHFIPSYILASPWDALRSLNDLFLSRKLIFESLQTIRSLVICTALSLALGLLLGIVAYRWKRVEEIIHPLTMISEQAPTIAWLVLAILWLGLGGGPPMVVGLSMAFPLYYLATVSELRQVDSGYIDMARVFNLPPFKRVTKILLPSLIPTLVGTTSGAISVAWRGIVMAEAFSTTEGLGPLLWGEYLYGNIDTVYAVILWILVLGLGIEYGIVYPVRLFVYRRMSHG